MKIDELLELVELPVVKEEDLIPLGGWPIGRSLILYGHGPGKSLIGQHYAHLIRKENGCNCPEGLKNHEIFKNVTMPTME